MWKQSNMLLQNQWVNDEIKEETGKYVKTSENMDAAKAVRRETFMIVNIYHIYLSYPISRNKKKLK